MELRVRVCAQRRWHASPYQKDGLYKPGDYSPVAQTFNFERHATALSRDLQTDGGAWGLRRQRYSLISAFALTWPSEHGASASNFLISQDDLSMRRPVTVKTGVLVKTLSRINLDEDDIWRYHRRVSNVKGGFHEKCKDHDIAAVVDCDRRLCTGCPI